MGKIRNLIVAFVVAGGMCSAKVGDMYVQRHRSDGWLFFVFSQTMPATKDNSLVKNMEYDYTYLENTDSVTMLFTLKTDLSQKPQSVSIGLCDTVYEADTEMIYAKPKGKGFIYRTKLVIPFRIWERMYDCDSPFSIACRFSGRGDAVSECRFGYAENKWASNRDKMKRIIETVKFNTGKK